MQQFSVPIIAVIFTFTGLLFGGTVGVLAKQILEKKMYGLYSFCGGILIGLLSLDLIPKTFSTYHIAGPLLGTGLGLLLMILVDIYFHSSAEQKTSQGLQAFFFLALAICIHNIPTGMALGASMAAHEEAASSLLLAIIFHHVPEGLALMISFLFTPSKLISYIFTIVSLSVVLGLGVSLGELLQIKVRHLQGFILGGAVGTLSYVTVHEFLWKATQKLSFPLFVLYTAAGTILIKLYLDLFHYHH
ncbi:ZIP family metal transporter [Bacillus sp. 165]|uniref:ZIP family metal transporter n=1 Tax=Bacillus sp. 165 TaxID=1529117 RepID=UPI001ADC1E4D|nr:ZIP family metal transporter [Bacillus sp. 165]MBO9128815.1 ZIP family metal transporter [Bacillus sp. 165]